MLVRVFSSAIISPIIRVLGVFIGEPKQIISPVGLNCKAAMEYAVSSTYGSDYVSDELSLTALAGDIRRVGSYSVLGCV